MRIFNVFRDTKGWLSLWERTVRYQHMRKEEEVKRRVKILDFWHIHGCTATKDAFGVSRRTLYRWQAILKDSKGKLDSLDPKSTAPVSRRKRVIPLEIETFIVNEREAHPRLGKKKLAVLINETGHLVSESYVGRVIHDLKERGVLRNTVPLSFYARTGKHHEKRITKRKKVRRTHKQGMEIDTIIRFINGTKRYILTAIDVENRFAFAGAYTTHSSANAADFLQKLIVVCPYPITQLQTDNGSEFALRFEEACQKLNLTHFHTYPRCPKMNAHIERFNRTVSEDFIMWNRALLGDDIDAFNEKLVDWLLWYNTIRPHESLGLISPLRYIVSTLSKEECQMLWTRTIHCQIYLLPV
jgi:transposase InsO family protein